MKKVTFDSNLEMVYFFQCDKHSSATHNSFILQQTNMHISSLAKSDKRREKLNDSLTCTAQDPFNMIDLSAENIRQEQSSDPLCWSIIKCLKYGTLPQDDKKARALLLRQEDYIIINNLLYQKVNNYGSTGGTTKSETTYLDPSP